MTRETIGGNICFTYIPSEKFKTGFFSAQMEIGRASCRERV